MSWNWTWLLDDVVVAVVCFATAAGAALSVALAAASSVWLSCCAARRRWVALPRPLALLGRPAGRAAALALLALSWDGLYMNDGGVNAVLLLAGLVVQVLIAVGGLPWRGRRVGRAHAAAALVWLLALVEMGTFSRITLRLGLDRSGSVLYACLAFEQDHGRLPQSLEELVPGYLPWVPRATWSVLSSFGYSTSPRPQLTYFSPWPYLRIYDFGRGQWHHEYLLRFQPREGDVPRAPRATLSERVARLRQVLSRGRILSGAEPSTPDSRDAWNSNDRLAFAQDAANVVMRGTAVAPNDDTAVATLIGDKR